MNKIMIELPESMDVVKIVLGGKIIAIQTHVKKQVKTTNKKPNITSKQLKKEEQIKHKLSRRYNKNKSKIIEMGKKTIKINETKSWFFEKINKRDLQLG